MAGTLLQELARTTGLPQQDVRRIMVTAPERYKSFQIPKRTEGFRTIHQPAREVKLIQRALVEVLLEQLPIHSAAKAYRKGLSLRDNAAPHSGGGAILKLDFRDFFPSIRSNDWVTYCRAEDVDLSPEEIQLTARLLFHRPPGGRLLRLAIGAPTSPMLSNILMNKLDQAILAIAQGSSRGHVNYTRYADDLTFSAPRTGYLNGISKDINRLLRATQSPRLEINPSKTVEATRKYRRVVTGLVLSNDGRVTIGRDRKREIHAGVHSALNGKLAPARLKSLSGFLAFINSVEPEFLDVLRRKYGAEIVEKIQALGKERIFRRG